MGASGRHRLYLDQVLLLEEMDIDTRPDAGHESFWAGAWYDTAETSGAVLLDSVVLAEQGIGCQ